MALWSRMSGRGGGNKTLQSTLKKITHSEVIDVPKELFTPVVEASHSQEDRMEIMRHLRECLAEPTGKYWRRIVAGMTLLEKLLKNGSPALITETAEGRHFDLVQRLSFLEHFDYSDKRVMNMVRSRAETMRKEVMPLIQNAGLGLKDTEEAPKDTASTCSPGSASVVTRSTMSSRGFGSDDMAGDNPPVEAPDPSKRTMVLNNIVSVGHNDDTTSESEGGEGTSRPVQFREKKKMTARERNDLSKPSGADSSDSEKEKRAGYAATQAPVPIMDDLLGGMETDQSRTQDLLGTEQKEDLLGGMQTVDLLGGMQTASPPQAQQQATDLLDL